MPRTATTNGKARNPEAARTAILNAALNEFALEGVDGARTDHIAKAAGVNKALLYYYFKDKEALYGAVLDHIFGGMFLKLGAAVDSKSTPREKVLAYVQAHFDYIAAAPLYPRVIMREMMRAGRTPSPHLVRIFKECATPVYAKLIKAIADGVCSGEFRPVNPAQVVPSMLGTIIFYFVSNQAQQIVTGFDPLAPERLAERRAAVLDFISHALLSQRTLDGVRRHKAKRSAEVSTAASGRTSPPGRRAGFKKSTMQAGKKP